MFYGTMASTLVLGALPHHVVKTTQNPPLVQSHLFYEQMLKGSQRKRANFFVSSFCFFFWFLPLFLDAPSHLYKRVCPSVRSSVGPSVRPSVPCYFQTRTRRVLCRVSGLVKYVLASLIEVVSVRPSICYTRVEYLRNGISGLSIRNITLWQLKDDSETRKQTDCQNASVV